MVAVGASYVAMACNAARTVKRHSPGLPVFLYTDGDISDDCFDRVVPLETPWRRSKIDAMIDSPFERTLYLDVDLFAVEDISDVFRLLDRFDIALAHDQERNSKHGRAIWRREFPACFPQFNSGVVAYARTEPVLTLLRAWRAAVHDNDLPRDQGALRELLWESDLRIATLPPEYNLLETSSIFRMSGASLAPRIIHNYWLHRARRNAIVNDVTGLLGPATAHAIAFMRSKDHFIARQETRPHTALDKLYKRALQVWMLADFAVRRLRTAIMSRWTPRGTR